MTVQQSAFFTPNDWKALVGAGVAKLTKQGRESHYTLDYASMDELLSGALVRHATIETVDEFKAEALTLETMVYEVVGLPNITREPPENPERAKEWINPFDGMCKIVQSRLRNQVDQGVMKQVLPQGLILFSGSLMVERTNAAGHKIPQKVTAYAVTSEPDVIKAFIADPVMEAAVVAERRKIRHWTALLDAVPEAAAILIASLDVQTAAVAARQQAAYLHAIAGFDPKQIAELDEAIREVAEANQTTIGPSLKALTSGGAGATSEDASA